MKKYVALIMVMVLALSMSMTAFAAEVDLIDKAWTDGTNALTKDSDDTTNDAYPEIEITLEIVSKRCDKASYDGYADGTVEIPDITVVKTSDSDVFVLTGADAIQGVGHFFYTVQESADPVAGVTYDDTQYVIEVLRTYIADAADPTVYTENVNIEYKVSLASNTTSKTDVITNTYKVGDLTIDKVVTGNLSNKNDTFKVDVTFTSDIPVLTDITMPDQSVVSPSDFAVVNGVYTVTKTVELSDNDGILTFTNIPVGVEVTVAEQNCDPYELVGYAVDGVSSSDVSIDMTTAGAAVVITNEYKTSIDTGISLDSLPYILVLVAVGGGLGYFFIKKRQNAFDAD